MPINTFEKAGRAAQEEVEDREARAYDNTLGVSEAEAGGHYFVPQEFTPEVVETARDELIFSGREGALLHDQWQANGGFERNLVASYRAAKSLERINPQLAELAEAILEDPNLGRQYRAAILSHLAVLGANLGPGFSDRTVTPNAPRQTSMNDTYSAPVPYGHAAAQEELDRLNETVPPGSSTYTSQKHQARLKQLYSAVHGDAPVVGTTGRTVHGR